MTNKITFGTVLVTLIAILGFSFISMDREKLIREDAPSTSPIIDSVSTPQTILYTQAYVDSVNEVLNQKNLESQKTMASTISTNKSEDFEAPHRSTWNTSMTSAPIHRSADGQMLKGVASYYHDRFSGRKTANGEIFSQHKYTAACNSLPLGTYLRVTNLRNNRSVVVKVNDRLAKYNRRVVDLSKVSAQKIGSVHDGLAKVKVEVISEAEALAEMNTY